MFIKYYKVVRLLQSNNSCLLNFHAGSYSLVSQKCTRVLLHTSRDFRQANQEEETTKKDKTTRSFTERLKERLNNTEVKWYSIPVGAGIAVIVMENFLHHIKKYDEEQERKKNATKEAVDDLTKRPAISGPWQVHVLGALPLRALSRLWGRLNNELTLPVWSREPLYRLYSSVFGCDLKEMEETDLKRYPNLGSFFYRSLKPSLRPIENNLLVSPADGKMLSFGMINEGRVEQVKGVTYSLDAFLGLNKQTERVTFITINSDMTLVDEKEFANVNGIQYTLDTLLGDDPTQAVQQQSEIDDDSIVASFQEGKNNESREAIVSKSVLKSPLYSEETQYQHHHNNHTVHKENALFFCVIYLAPGDYHRFHSPTNWVVEMRRHFAGELFSVSPYMTNLMPDLFVLNERVVLVGRWKYGFFSMIPVGATNVGSIKINFDQALRTNRKEDLVVGKYTEVSYRKASKLLGGQPLKAGDEMGGFALGSTIVLVFEAPIQFAFSIVPGQKVKYGQTLGDLIS
ncbi:1737_t:CDS:2 [Ambispora gerdemannii]|uniref:Phosphatidylserine decarboxylase proenzyme 1, mitochondrial n=1 Tax=Ambispora gerdemannii TaxID=144530 RepID=A0A9N9GNJ0_9GLOM|nr:1737_t:CDS:2 [Ambispora gerdemannii]